MTLTASPHAITRASDADHHIWSHRMRAHIFITREGLEYRSYP